MTPAQRHRCMSRIRSKDTTPEKRVRQVEDALHDNYLCTFSHKAKPYILVDEENLPMAAEDNIGYN